MLFKNVNLTQAGLNTLLLNNIVAFFDYGLVEQSGYVDVSIPSTGYTGGLDHRLRYVNDPNYASGKVWQSYKSNWVYESGFGLTPQVYVNNTLTTGVQINYKNGSILLNTAVASTTVVTAQYSYKYVQVDRIEGINTFKQLIDNVYSADSAYINNSGRFAYLPQNRYQLPMIGVELSRRTQKPRQLGGGQIVYTDVLIHCIANDSYTRDQLLDIVNMQYEKRFRMFDLNTMAAANDFPLKNGIMHSGKNFPDLVTNYPSEIIRFASTNIDSVYSLTPTIHIGTVRCQLETYFGV